MIRVNTSQDLQFGVKHTTLQHNLDNTHSYATLFDANDNKLAVFNVVNFHNMDLEVDNVSKGPHVNIVMDKVRNRFVGALLTKLMGHSFGKCEKRYVILVKNNVVGNVVLNCLKKSLKFKCIGSYNWVIEDCVANPVNPPQTIKVEPKEDDLSRYLYQLCDMNEKSMSDYVNALASISSEPKLLHSRTSLSGWL